MVQGAKSLRLKLGTVRQRNTQKVSEAQGGGWGYAASAAVSGGQHSDKSPSRGQETCQAPWRG